MAALFSSLFSQKGDPGPRRSLLSWNKSFQPSLAAMSAASLPMPGEAPRPLQFSAYPDSLRGVLWQLVNPITQAICEEGKDDKSGVASGVRATIFAPGRINILGEHIDYNGYPVAPIAIPKGIAIVLQSLRSFSLPSGESKPKDPMRAPRLDLLKDKGICLGQTLAPETATLVRLLNNVDDFPPSLFAFDIANAIPVEPLVVSRSWRSYVEAGFRATQDYLRDHGLLERFAECFAGKDIVLRVHGNVPIASGLSSSSALTCASALTAFAQILVEAKDAREEAQLPEIDLLELPRYVLQAERLVGLEGGGMDQTISLLAKAGTISIIDFQPGLRIANYPFPAVACFYALSSLKDSHKILSDSNFYNTRVCECRMGCQLLLCAWKKANPNVKLEERLQEVGIEGGLEKARQLMCRDLQLIYGVTDPVDMLPYVEELPKSITLADLALKLCGDQDASKALKDLIDNYLIGSNLMPLLTDITPATRLVLRRRLRHVYSEAHRVELLRNLLRENQEDIIRFNEIYDDVYYGSGNGQALFLPPAEENLMNTLLDQISELIRASHLSCARDYECSCAELDEVTTLAMEGGALGARLTGAGFGGYAVALVNETRATQFEHTMGEYYGRKNAERDAHKLPKYGMPGTLLIKCESSPGALVSDQVMNHEECKNLLSL